MSDQTSNTPNATQDASKPARKARTKAERVEFKTVIARYAKQRKIDPVRAGKELRGKARREFATIAKLDPAHFGPKGKNKEQANDGRPWASVNARTAEFLLTRKGSK
jgi:hypothetical protein